jgi:beta-lactamase class A
MGLTSASKLILIGLALSSLGARAAPVAVSAGGAAAWAGTGTRPYNLGVLSAPRTPGEDRQPPLSATMLASAIEDVLGDELDHYGIVVRELQNGTGVTLNSGRVFYAASLFKLAIMHEAFRQREASRLDFLATLTVTEEDLEFDLGTSAFEIGDEVSIERLIELMIVVSDNTAAIMLLRRLGNYNVDAGLEDLGLTATSVNTEELPTTARDMALLMEAIATGAAVSPAASEEMAFLLLGQRIRNRIPAGVPQGVPVANKTGDWDDAAHDAAIVYAPSVTYVMVVLSDDPYAHSTIVELSRRVYEHYNGVPFCPC